MTRYAAIDSPYAWLRLGAALLLTTVGCAGMYISMVALPAYQAEFPTGRADAALPFTLVMLGFGVGGIAIGRFVDRFGIVRPLAVTTILLCVTLVFASRAENFAQLAALHLAIGAFGCAAVFSPLLADISTWFARRRGLAIAICASGNYLAGAIWPPIMIWSIDEFGWRDTYALLGVLSAVVMLPTLLALRRRPRDVLPEAAGGGSAGSPAMLGLSETRLVVLLGIAGIGCCTAMAMPQAHVVSLTIDLGIAARHGAEMLSLMFGFGVLSRLGFGWLSDRIGGLRTLLAGSTLQCLALVLFLPADGLSLLYGASALFGLFQGGIVPSYALIVREYFPASEAGGRTGTIIFATLIGMAFGGWISGAIRDWTGSYDAAFLHGIAWNLLNMAIMSFLVLRDARSPQPLSDHRLAPRSD